MTDPTPDQIAAAQADARNMMKTTLGSDGPTSGTSPIIERYLVRVGRVTPTASGRPSAPTPKTRQATPVTITVLRRRPLPIW
ncbi:hypothetical protein [Streptomyces europaeiscabiei]|uniref:hypothetical protein n=1 Tax=Streptomyces europaeiscabiei TaxID=146819 RepID=UPI0029AFB3BD|nr:hypothetical protein [Streptomyces europaeiscabiei]MDX3611244.1 hypothetical protein [Streptomyces europaeiscabiei]